jgi:NTE family protein
LYKRTHLKSLFYRFLLLLLQLFFASSAFSQQKVGLVLSGGGATGFAHIGVLQALEEKGIPIDYITGTSAGALIGSLYAAGWSPNEIRDYCTNENFLTMALGELKPSQEYFSKENEPNSSMFSFWFSIDSLINKSLPTNFTNSTFLDFEMMRLLGTVGEAYGNDFNHLFVPFRCLASDIVSKENVIFRNGNLNEAVRASMTYPFYFQPLRVNGRLLFDGGLYNNFPGDVLYKEFLPDYIIGSNVSYNADAPMEDDLISQVTNMLVRYTNFSLPCEDGILIEPELEIGTFDFDEVQRAIDVGYAAGIKYADSILPYIATRADTAELNRRRREFREKVPALVISSVSSNLEKNGKSFVKQSMLKQKGEYAIDEKTIEKRYFRLSQTEHISFLYPKLELDTTNLYKLDLTVRKKNNFKFDIGGHFSSRPVNTTYLGLTYFHLGKAAWKIHADSYFGKFYGSINTNIQVEIPSLFPVTFEPYFTMNRWDYFRSFATFFEDVQPSFLVQNELYFGLRFWHPIGNNTKSTFDFRNVELNDDYYQTDQFTAIDTADITIFKGQTLSWKIEHNTLNRKQFANSGHQFAVKARYVIGQEESISGSTSPIEYDIIKGHSWINFNFEGQTFPIDFKRFHLGLQGKATFNSQSLFSNYTATILTLSEFVIIPDIGTYFLPEYRSPLFIGGGFNAILSLRKNIDVRADGFIFQPLTQLVKNDDGTFGYSKPFKGESYLASASFIYHSIFGPLRASLNYFPKQTNAPLNFQISFGYVLFNERAIR